MASQFARADLKQEEAPKPKSIQLEHGDAAQQLWQRLNAFISDHAFYTYQSTGGEHGKDQDHWHSAQSKFVSADLEIRESGSWFHCNCNVPNLPPDALHLAIDNRQVVIHLTSGVSSNPLPHDGSMPLFYWARWPQQVDPATAAAYILNGIITIEVKKTDPPTPNPDLLQRSE
jgi:HSP20 family molecular chaperone IbpA